jgi:hypothetical protein
VTTSLRIGDSGRRFTTAFGQIAEDPLEPETYCSLLGVTEKWANRAAGKQQRWRPAPSQWCGHRFHLNGRFDVLPVSRNYLHLFRQM